METTEDIYKASKLLFEKSIEHSSKLTASQICEVTKVDRERRTCSLYYHAGEVEYLECRLCSVIDLEGENITTFFPKVGTFVQAIPSEKNRSVWLVISVHQTDGIELNGNKYSMAKAEELQEQLNKLRQTVNLILNAINNGVPAGSPDAGLALQNSMKAIIAPAQDADFSNIINDKVKHG